MISLNYAECRKVTRYAECRKEANHAECHYAECLYAECRGAHYNIGPWGKGQVDTTK